LGGSLDDVVELGGKTVDSPLIEQRLKDFAKGTLEFQDVLDDYSEVYAEIINGNKNGHGTKVLLMVKILAMLRKNKLKIWLLKKD
ncbi:hypothetical protein, partial [Streptococcus oralis]|uniref:hypothetical protein n=1 Tax=Streptococcus oralis TaxID=1303 RepID=UPI001E4C001E